MAAQATLVLRDIHQPPAPPWWPPAPGWWLLAGLLVAGAAVWLLLRGRRRRRIAANRAVFDAALADARTPPEQIAAMSELLRRAARRHDPAADRLQGEAWLAFLDAGDAARPFAAGAGRVLLDGGFRADTTPAQAAALRPLARARFLQLLERPPAAGRSGRGRKTGARGLFRRSRARAVAVAAAGDAQRLAPVASQPAGRSPEPPQPPGTARSDGRKESGTDAVPGAGPAERR